MARRRRDPKTESRVVRLFEEARTVVEDLVASADLQKLVAEVARVVTEALLSGHKVLLCGNGGSAADSQHIAGELVGRFRRERAGALAVALTTDSSILTSVANDYGYAEVFRRQVEALGRKGDVLLAYSTSGNAENVLRAVEQARETGLCTVGMTGSSGGKLASVVDIAVQCPSDLTPRIQECHAIIGHVLCDLVDEALFESKNEKKNEKKDEKKNEKKSEKKSESKG